MDQNLCRDCAEYDNECWYCWSIGCHTEPEAMCENFKPVDAEVYE